MNAYEELIAYARENLPELYERVLMEDYVDENGLHFNERYAKNAVEKMHHKNADGSDDRGEHWTIDQVKAQSASYMPKLPDCVTVWDIYVAVNMWWHDLGANYKKRNAGTYVGDIFDDAITWSFMDEDAPDGKLWRYIAAMNE